MTSVLRRFIGLDVHKRVVEVCIIDAKGRILSRLRIGAERRDLELDKLVVSLLVGVTHLQTIPPAHIIVVPLQ